MTAGRYHIKIEKGADLLLTIDVKDSTSSAVNFSGYPTVRSKFKNFLSDTSSVLEANNTNSDLHLAILQVVLILMYQQV